MLSFRFLRHCARFSNNFRKQLITQMKQLTKFQQLQRQNKYEQILQTSKQSDYNQLNKNYYRLIKKYHSDSCGDDKQKALIYDEIIKIITKAFRQIEKESFKRSDKREQRKPGSPSLEDKVCMELFGKNYEQSKYQIFQQGNKKKRDEFFNRMFAQTGSYQYKTDDRDSSSTKTQYPKPTYHSPKLQESSQKNSSSIMPFLLGGAGLVLASLFYFLYESNKPVKKADQPIFQYADPNSKPIETVKPQTKYVPRKKTVEQKVQALIERDNLIKTVVKEHPPCLHIPSDHEPDLMKQLTEYSIAPDIHLYEVNPIFFTQQEKKKVVKNQFDMNRAFPLKRIKPNTALTLSLEAQRAFHNTYVKVKDVISEIKQTGKFTPPKIFLRFHGYILCELRQKPMTLVNYRDTDYISIFDLFFQFYSPMFLKRDHFAQYLVSKDDIKNFGHVYINNRKCKSVYLEKGQKYAYFHEAHLRKNSKVLDYEQLWGHYYKTYYSKWAKY